MSPTELAPAANESGRAYVYPQYLLRTVHHSCKVHVFNRINPRLQAPTPDQQNFVPVAFSVLPMLHPSRSPQSYGDTSSSNHRYNNPPPLPGVAATASKFFVSMRKSLSPQTSPRRKNAGNQRAAMYSTPEERPPYNPSRAARSRHLDSSANRPTIEQIAMGLHVSRTPHLRAIPNPLQLHSLPSSPSRPSLNSPVLATHASPYDRLDTSTSSSQYRTRHSLPPPPSRSSMKKTSTSVSTLAPPQQHYLSSGASPSISTVTSGGPATPESSRPLSSLRLRVSKFIPGYRPSSLSSSLGRASSFTSSASDSTRPMTPRKAVRFSSSVLGIDEQSS